MFVETMCTSSLLHTVFSQTYFVTAEKRRTADNTSIISRPSYPKRDLNPHSHHWPRDFKSLVSTDSTIRASYSKGILSPSCLPIPPSGHPIQRTRAANETRTRAPDLGKVVLYQLSYCRIAGANVRSFILSSKHFPYFLSKCLYL